MRHTAFVITLVTALPVLAQAPAEVPQEARAQEPTAAPGFGGSVEPEVTSEILKRLEALEARLTALTKQPPATSQEATAIAASIQETQQQVTQLQQQVTDIQARELAARASALDRASFNSEAIRALEQADVALYFGEVDQDDVAEVLAAASVALNQAALEADRMGRVAERDHAANATEAVNLAIEALGRDDASDAREFLAVAYRRAQLARTLASTDGG